MIVSKINYRLYFLHSNAILHLWIMHETERNGANRKEDDQKGFFYCEKVF